MMLVAVLFANGSVVPASESTPGLNDANYTWPAMTNQCRPWTYWWWMGSAVDQENLGREFKRYREAGLGGMHIVPIYGVKGAESRFIEYLSPSWMNMLDFTVREAGRLDLGVDMTTGTGWCFGGPTVPAEEAGMAPALLRETLKAGETIEKRWRRPQVQAVTAVANDKQTVDLLALADASGSLKWNAGEKDWTIVTLEMRPTAVHVKRSGPGGEGFMINPAYAQAMRHYLERFTQVFDAYRGAKPRAMYHDSYEYKTSWTPDLLAQFEKCRGYRLQDHLAELASNKEPETTARLLGDYRETVSDMIVEDVFPPWIAWCRDRGIRTRNQAHGSPSNLLDFYALADIPETEMFARGGRDPLQSRFDEHFAEGRNPLVSKFASSAAHVAGRRLVAAETCTWMAEHFCETLEEMKCLADLMFVSGINHIFYHGCCYSPDDAAWPGWLFYASTEMNPRSAIWHDAPALNAYIARCQSVLQLGEPDQDVLLYWPIHDLWHTAPQGPLKSMTLISCSIPGTRWLDKTPLYQAASLLWNRGWGFDYISDRQLADAKVSAKEIAVPGGRYRTIVVPATTHIPLATLKKLFALAEQGGTVIFLDKLPQDVPGLGDLERRRAALQELSAGLKWEPLPGGQVQQARLGQGRVLVGKLEESLNSINIRREEVVDHPGMRFIRRRHNNEGYYFITNQSTNRLDGWVPLATKATSVAVMDPLTGQIQKGNVRSRDDGRVEIRLCLEPGHSIILHTLPEQHLPGEALPEQAAGVVALELPGPWQVKFLAGGPEIPKSYETSTPASWTKNGDPETERFAGTALYRTTFDAPAAGPYWLDLGEVCHSARIRINGRDYGTLIMHPYRVFVGDLKAKGNLLEVEVTNLSANRIRDLDRRKINWRIFYNTNLVNINYKPFDATNWPIFDSGLLGPVKLHTVK